MRILLLFLLITCGFCATAQITVRGRVLTEDHRPLPGATVKLAGTNAGTHTDTRGLFNLDVPRKQGMLEITFTGYVPRLVDITDTVTLTAIILSPDESQLKEVTVSSGYQQVSRKQATGAYGAVSKELIERNPATDLTARLDGITPSLAFDNRAPGHQQLSVRGRSTILSDNSPLVVVDNFPFEGDLHDLNPNDVENITVLKDAAASAIWGARAGNGVIVVTTKHGKYNRPAHLSFNASWTAGGKPDLFYNPAFLPSADFIGVEQQLFQAGFYSAAENDPAKPVLSPAVELMIQNRDGQLSDADLQTKLAALSKIDVRNDFGKYFYRKSLSQQYSLSLDGGGERYNYLVSGGFDDNRSNLVGNSDNRYTLHAVSNFRLLKNLMAGADLSYSSTHGVNDNPGYSGINSGGGKTLYPYAQLAGAVAKDYPLSFSGAAQGNGFLDWQYRPVAELGLADNVSGSNDVRLKFNLKYDVFRDLSAEALYQYQHADRNGSFLYSRDTYYTRNLINEFTQPGNQYIVPDAGILDSQHGALDARSGRFQLNYGHVFGERHQLNVLAGAEVRDTHTRSMTSRLYGYDPDILVSQPVDYTNYYTINPSGNSLTIPYVANLSDQTDRYVSAYLNANYNYAGRYFLSASARKDESNLFGVNANQKGVPLYSFGGAWEASKESFYHMDWLPYLKLRASYGVTGNVNKTVTAFTTAVYATDPYTNQPAAIILTPPNPDLHWEKVKTLNIGLDFETKNNRLSGSLDYFTKKGTDQIGSVALDPTTGFFVSDRYSYSLNSSSIAGHGLDIELNTVNIKGAIGWQTRFLFSYVTDKVTKYQYTSPVSAYLSPNSPPLAGKPVLGIYSYKWAGLDPATGDPVVYLNGAPSKDYAAIAANATVKDLVYNGPALPPVFGSVMNTVTWKQFSLSANITYKFGYYFHRSSISYSDLINNWSGHRDFDKRWQKPGDEQQTSVPSLSLTGVGSRDAAYLGSSILVDKGDNIRLQDVRFSWTLGKITFYAYASNLGLLWRANKDSLDPDYVYGTSTIRPVHTYSLGVRAHF
ncbi:SusC/RagA family TonB-linked outer membrane protein [Mucilaginibacter sp. L3T2-6]|uniref:SusC/RagA family TonB-linked outer membrane protein n=1 Tax=Mucilaginibacter sp. L3T2-6 TaxID=3062491 RepID=UPI0026765940|nr:SusC/RagA family TonB-linked outer membrane protein [Mucilaginibacter sp. L3T2-6]MDO3641256.1 SusC/RagA family TonB-linked outer membrane protein [Mucilaginibacter sp. L3T2-6]MDV6213984.1 SusC/RagA family TonB-linked outer membrane protein [Mucilaginibacter sp. L3T2-6]